MKTTLPAQESSQVISGTYDLADFSGCTVALAPISAIRAIEGVGKIGATRSEIERSRGNTIHCDAAGGVRGAIEVIAASRGSVA